ncbi:MAG: TolC family protein [Bacteriovoracia bacterium]
MGTLKTLQTLMVIGISALAASPALADHPNAGNVTLSSLIEEAFKNNIEIKEVEKEYEASTASRKQAISPYFPEIAVEGGYQNGKFDNESSSGSFGYGAARINLYNGGKDQAQVSIRSEEEKFQKLKLEKTKSQIEREISRKYYELLYLQEGIAVKEEALKANKAQNELALRKKSAGFTSQADVLEFELREATLNSDINLLRREETAKERELRRLLGRDDGPIIRVGGHLRRERFTQSDERLIKLALEERIDLKESEKNIAVSSLQYRSLFGGYLPRIDVEGKYGKLAGEERIFNNYNNSVVMLKVSIPIFSGLDTVYARQAQASEIAKNELSAGRVRQEIKVQIENALSGLRSIEERLNIEENNIERANKYYTITLAEYKKGVKNSPDVASAAERLFDAKLRNLEFRKDFYLTQIEIAEAAGVSSLEPRGK